MPYLEFIRIISREHYIYCCLQKQKKRSFALAASPHCNRTAQRLLTSNIGINHVTHHRTGQGRTGQHRTSHIPPQSTRDAHTLSPRPGAFEAKKSHQEKKIHQDAAAAINSLMRSSYDVIIISIIVVICCHLLSYLFRIVCY